MLTIYFKRTGKKRQNFEGNSGTKTKLGNREHKKTFFFFILGEQGNKPIYFRGTREQVPTLGRGRLLISCVLMREQKKMRKVTFFELDAKEPENNAFRKRRQLKKLSYLKALPLE